MPDESVRNVLVIGSGPAGWTAGIYAARALLRPLLISGIDKGGQLSQTTGVENFPGFAQAVQGPDLMAQMEQQALASGVTVHDDQVTRLDLGSRPFVAHCDGGTVVQAHTVILATGARARWLGLESEQHFRGYGVSACATCDGFFFRDKPVMIVGGGNTALEEALYLSRIAKRVWLVHRRDRLRADKILQERLQKTPSIEVLWNRTLQAVIGEETPRRVTGARLRSVLDGQEQSVDVDGIFVAIGHIPAVDLVKDQLELSPSGCVAVKPHSTRTTCPGVFAAGDVMDDVFRQAVTAAGTGCMAALEAEQFIAARRPP